MGTNNLHRLNEYGLNFSIFNFGGGGLSFPHSLFFTENNFVTTGASPQYDYLQTISSRRMRSGTALDIDAYVRSGEWFGVEVAADIGTMGNADGRTDFWIYDKNGTEMGQFTVTGENRLLYFDHWYNKLVLGGNRLSGNGMTGQSDSRWWIDDVIVHGSRIGTIYFQTLTAHSQLDTTAPSAEITAPSSSATVTGVVSVSVRAAGNVRVSKIELYVDGGLHASDSSGTLTWDTTRYPNGSYDLMATSYDEAGNVGISRSVSLNVLNAIPDTTAPAVSIVYPSAGSTVSGTVMISVAASDNVEVSKVELHLNGAIYSVFGSTPYNVPWNTTDHAGLCTWVAKAYDAAGNVASTSPVEISVADSVAPSIAAFAMQPTSGSVTVPISSFKVSDNIAVVGYLITESSTPPAADSPKWRATVPLNFTFTKTGIRTAYAWAKDAAGNVSSFRSTTVNVEVSPLAKTSLPDTAPARRYRDKGN